MALKKNYYAVKKGFDKETSEIINNRIYKSWDEVKRVVTGVSKKKCGISPEYAGFVTLEEAESYLEFEAYIRKEDNTYSENALHCYVDGSCLSDGSAYSHGIAFVKNKKVLDVMKGKGTNPDVISQRQVGGELMGAMLSLVYASKYNHDDVVIFFDYKGVACHAMGTWKRSTDIAIMYYDWMQNFFKTNPNINVTFCKVDAHTGDEFNEIADGLAKSALGITPDDISLKYAEQYGILDKMELE